MMVGGLAMSDVGSGGRIRRDEQLALLRIAREAVEAAARGEDMPPLEMADCPEWLRAPGASFVTLTRSGALRGCIGGLQAAIPLATRREEHALAAATEDYRFLPVQPEELAELEIEVSVLTEPRALEYAESPGVAGPTAAGRRWGHPVVWAPSRHIPASGLGKGA